ncbi:MAG: AAA family ATPase [Nitrososphaerota archaeon]|nr:AAA family ATPase [Nitrososphaerota archaeon]
MTYASSNKAASFPPLSRVHCFVVTGSAYVGKTSTLLAISRHYPDRVLPELALDVLRPGTSILGRCRSGPAIIAFQRDIVREKVELLETKRPGWVGFSDRGVPDALAYLRWQGINPPRDLVKASLRIRYARVVFIFPPWRKVYQRSVVRPYSFDDMLELDKVIRETYESLGYTMVTVPRSSVADRTRFLVGYLGHLGVTW